MEIENTAEYRREIDLKIRQLENDLRDLNRKKAIINKNTLSSTATKTAKLEPIIESVKLKTA